MEVLRKSGCLEERGQKTQTQKKIWRGVLLLLFSKKKQKRKSKERRGHAQRWGWWMRGWWHFDRGNLELTGPRLSHESKRVSQALEMEARSLWLWHPSEGLRLLGVKCDTSLGPCWFSAATVQQTSSHGVSGGVRVRGVGGASTVHRTENGGLVLFIHMAIIWQHTPPPSQPVHTLYFPYIFIFKHAYW